jgi:hypothetical protein
VDEFRSAQEIHDICGGQDRLEAHDVVAGHPVLQPPQAARAAADVAAERRGDLAAGVRRVEKAGGRRRLGQRPIADRRLAHRHQVLRVELEQPVHARGDEHDPAALRNAGGRQVRARAARNDRHGRLGGQAQDVGHLGDVAREDDEVGTPPEERRGVGGVGLPPAVVGAHVLGPDHVLKTAPQLGG